MKPRNTKAMHLFMQNRGKAESIQYRTFASEVKFVAVVSNDRVTAHLSWLRRKTGSGNQMSRTCNKSVYYLLYTCILPIIIIIIITITLMDAFISNFPIHIYLVNVQITTLLFTFTVYRSNINPAVFALRVFARRRPSWLTGCKEPIIYLPFCNYYMNENSHIMKVQVNEPLP